MNLAVEAETEGESIGCFVAAPVKSMAFEISLLLVFEVNRFVHLQLKFVIFTKYLSCNGRFSFFISAFLALRFGPTFCPSHALTDHRILDLVFNPGLQERGSSQGPQLWPKTR